MNVRVQETARGAILFDRDLLGSISEADFEPANWREAMPVPGRLRAAGRGRTVVVKDARGEYVLRHFKRGGLIGRFVSDRYLWLGREGTRSFAEWRLLSKLVNLGLPVPRPAAARYVRFGLTYQADLITARIPGVVPLSERMARPTPDELWRRMGRQIRAFHDAGVHHADLNAYNVQIDRADKLWLVDFDRGRLRPAGSWPRTNLARLKRSLEKVKRLDPDLHYCGANWESLLGGYADAVISA